MFLLELELPRAGAPVLLLGAGLVGLVGIGVHFFEGGLRRTLGEVRVIVRDLRESVAMVCALVRLPHITRMIEYNAREDTTGFSWRRTYDAIDTVRATAFAVRDTINGNSIATLAQAAAPHVDRLFDLLEQQQQQQQQQQQHQQQRPGAPAIHVAGTAEALRFASENDQHPPHAVAVGSSSMHSLLHLPHGPPDVALRVLHITSNIKDMVCSIIFVLPFPFLLVAIY